MIAKLKGKIDELKPTEIILDVNGVGYHLSIPLSTYVKIQGHDDILLYVYTLHKEDAFKLYGFISDKDKQLFSILLGISGIGPVMALSILSGISTELLLEAVRSENPGLLTGIPGIGKTKAEKIVFELKRKIKKIETLSDSQGQKSTIQTDAVNALISLGFNEATSMKAINDIVNKFPDIPIENLLKTALKTLSSC